MVRMLNVSILRGATAVGASQDSLEMDTTVQVLLGSTHPVRLAVD